MGQQLSTNTFGVAKWVVSPDPTQGTHTTISAALSAASSGDTIWIRTGTYTENITGVAGVTLQAINSNSSSSVLVNGTLSFTAAGIFTVNGLEFSSTGSPAVSISGSAAAQLFCDSSEFTATGANTFVNTNTSSSSIQTFNNCVFASDTTHSCLTVNGPPLGAGAANSFSECVFLEGNGNGSTSSTISTGRMSMNGCVFQGNLYVTNGANSSIAASYCTFVNNSSSIPALTIDSSDANVEIFSCLLVSGNAGGAAAFNSPCNLKINNSVGRCSGAYAFSGNGTVKYTLVSANNPGNAVFNPTLTTTPFAVRLGTFSTLTSVNTGMSPYTILSTDDYLSVDCSGGPVTLLFPDSPNVGQIWVVKDATGSSATNSITISTVSGVDMIDGFTSQTMSTNYEALQLIGSSSSTYQIF